MKKWLLKVGLLLFGITLIVGYLFYNKYDNFLKSPVFESLPITIEIDKGSTFIDFVKRIKSYQGNGELWQWKLMARLHPDLVMIKAGEFEFLESQTPRELIEYVTGNNVKTYSYTLIEGHNWKLIRSTLKNHNFDHMIDGLTDDQVKQKLSIQTPHLEGQFLPETYQYVKGDSDLEVLSRAHESLEKVLKKAWENRDPDVQLKSSYELLILASIIEKETAVASERGDISGVFHRRLRKGMKLQTDPTVIYGIGDAYDGDITRNHLDTDTPYNTYTRSGLPPTPIAMASQASIEAAAHPNPGNTLYFVANGQGGHTFSETYDEHLQAVTRMLKGAQTP